MITLTIIATWKLLVKAGEKGWKCLIPFYGDYVMFKTFYDKRLFWNILIGFLSTAVLAIIAVIVAAPKLMAFYYGFYGYSYGYSSFHPFSFAGIGIPAVLAIIMGIATLILTIAANSLLLWYTGKAFGAKPIHCLGMIFLPVPCLILLGLEESFTFCGNQRPFCIPKREKKHKEETEDSCCNCEKCRESTEQNQTV